MQTIILTITRHKKNSNLIACPQKPYFLLKVDFFLYARKWKRGDAWRVVRKRKRLVRFNFHVYSPPFIHCLYFIHGWFPLLCYFHVRTHVHFTRLNKVDAMYERSHVNVKVEPGSTFTFTRDLPHVATILSTRVKFTIVRTWKLRSNGNPPLGLISIVA